MAEAGKFVPAFVIVVHVAIGLRRPHDLRHSIRKLPEPGLRSPSTPIRTRLLSVMSRAILEAPMMTPCAFFTGEIVSEISMQRAIFSSAHRLEVIDAFALSEAGENIGLFLLSILGDQKAGHCLADCLFCCIAEKPFRAFVPTRDHAVKILANDGIVR